jgi:hypothetical protein
MTGETEVFSENLPQCHFVYHKPHMLCPDENLGRRGWKPATNHLNYGTNNVLVACLLEISWPLKMTK